MNRNLILSLFLIMIYLNTSAQTNPIKEILAQNPDLFKTVLEAPNQKEVQIIYTQINRDKNNKAHFKTFCYGLNDEHYFYPASTVKLPTAIFALEKLNELNIKGLDKSTLMKTGADFGQQTKVDKDSSSASGEPSVENYIKKILLVSDNDAFNRIYEFVDRASINQKLQDYGFQHSKITNRLSIGDGGENAKHTNPIDFYTKDELVYHKPAAFDPKEYSIKLNNLTRGKGYLNGNDSLINEPFDFSEKNVFQLSDQHELMKRLMFPTSFPKKKQFNLKADDYDFLYTFMSKYPTESTHPTYAQPAYYPAYCKFLFYGADPKAAINPNIRIFNKVGDSYGYTIDNIYFIDYENHVEFILSAVIQSNDNEIYNDNHYEYETVCFPFMRNLGEKIYELELNRIKKNEPNFSSFEKFR